MMKSTLYYAETRENPKNCFYPHAADLSDPEQLHIALQHDHVLAHFRNDYRNRSGFLSATVIGVDIDNDHSEDERNWITPEDIRCMLPGVSFVLVYSRHNGKEKGEGKQKKSPRPRFHLLFPIREVTDPAAYEALKQKLAALLPYADRNALDAARMFYGTEKPDFSVQEGEETIDSFLSDAEEEEIEVVTSSPDHAEAAPVLLSQQTIPIGSRNKTMHSFALSVLKRYGETEDAYSLYLRKAETCEAPLPDEELTAIWKSAVKYYNSFISTSPGYLSPDQYTWIAESENEPEWEEPVPLEFFEYPEFPLYSLPDTVRNYVTALSASKGAPVEMAACYALAVISLCNQKKYRIQVKPDWLEPVNLYILIIAEKSERKSQIINAMTDIVLDYQNQYNRSHKVDISLSRDDWEYHEAKLKKIKKMRDNNKATLEDVEQAEKELNKVTLLSPLELFIDDTTSEALCIAMTANGEKMAVLSSEGDVFGNLGNRYSSDPNIGIWLKAYSGDYYKSKRVGRDPVELQNPVLTIGVASQPATLRFIIGNKNLRERGLPARLLITFPKSLVGTREFETPPVPDEVKKAFSDLIANMLEIEPDGPASVITLSPEALALLHAFYDEVEAKLLTEYAAFSDWGGKLVGNVARIAANLCRASVRLSSEVFDDNTCYTPLVVSGETMQNAIDLGRYFIEIAKVAFSPCCDLHTLNLARRILDVLLRNNMRDFSLRELTRHLPSACQVKETLEPVLALLAEHGYIAPKPAAAYSGKGRPASGRYLVNPRFLKSAA